MVIEYQILRRSHKGTTRNCFEVYSVILSACNIVGYKVAHNDKGKDTTIIDYLPLFNKYL